MIPELRLCKSLCKCHGMKSIELETSNETDSKTCTAHGGQFTAARDSRNRRVPGLAIRNRRFYCVLWTDRGDGRKAVRRLPLLDAAGAPIRGLAEAKNARDLIKAAGLTNHLPKAGRRPLFADYAAEYLGLAATRAKKPRTLEKEVQALARWTAHLAGLRLDAVKTPVIAGFRELRQRAEGCTLAGKHYKAAHPRTIALDLVSLRNCLRAAEDAGHLDALPKFPKIPRVEPPRRSLITPDQFAALLAGCTATKADGAPVTKNGEQLRDFLRFAAYTGAREQEALAVRWAHVDFPGERVFIGAPADFEAGAFSIGTGGTSKNRGSRAVDFNPQLAALLREMHARRAPDCAFMFPSPQRGQKDIPAKTLRESMEKLRAHVGLPKFGFHHLRVFFISYGIMGGADFMTLAKWVGHRDGGVLIGKIYGDIAQDHSRRAAASLTFGIAAVNPEGRLAGAA